jgi:RNA polymerase sigma-70 factor (ECF subfamily)
VTHADRRSPPRGGERITFNEVFHAYAPFVWRVVRRMGVAESDVEDVCQDAFLVVHRRLDEFEGRSSLRTWIYGVCVRVASEHRRRPHLRHEALGEKAPERSVPAPQHDDLERRRAVVLLDRALGELDADKRAVFVLYEIEELQMSEIAETLGCPIQTAYSRLHAARKIVDAAFALWSAERPEPEHRAHGEGSAT